MSKSGSGFDCIGTTFQAESKSRAIQLLFLLYKFNCQNLDAVSVGAVVSYFILCFVGVGVVGVGVDQDFWLSKRRSSQSGRSKTSNDKNS